MSTISTFIFPSNSPCPFPAHSITLLSRRTDKRKDRKRKCMVHREAKRKGK